jgi:hypothetical protein
MNSMSGMPMTATEKQMMNTIYQTAETSQMLIDVNQHLVNAVGHDRGNN